jgi:hypothetical protein
VPSLSKTAMRSGTCTKSGEPGFVTFATNSTIAFFADPSFHEDKGSVSAVAGETATRTAVTATNSAGTHAFLFIVFLS